MKLNYEQSMVDNIIAAIEVADQRVVSVSLNREERHTLYRQADPRFVKTRGDNRHPKGLRGYIRFGRHVLPVLAEEEVTLF